MYFNGVKRQDIAIELECSKGKMMADLKFYRKQSIIPEESRCKISDMEAIDDAFKAGKSYRVVAEMFNVYKSTIYRHYKKSKKIAIINKTVN